MSNDTSGTTETETIESVNASRKSLSRANSRTELATRTHYAFVAYFDGDDPTGAIRSQTKSLLGASLALLRGESATEANAYATGEKEELRAELEAELESFYGEDSDVSVDVPVTSVGPLLPHILAYLRTVEECEAADGDGFEETSLAGDE